MKLANWTSAATGQWPGVITDDKYIETITMGNGSGEYDSLTSNGSESRQDCTQDNCFIRVFKIQPTAHKLAIQLHVTTQLGTGMGIKLGVFGTIDETTNDALWCRIPDQGIGAATHQHASDVVSSTSGAALDRTNLTYNPFGVLTNKTELAAQRGEFDHVGHSESTDLSTTTDDLHFLPGGAATTTLVGKHSQYFLNVDQLAYDYIAIRLTGSAASASGALKLIVRQFN